MRLLGATVGRSRWYLFDWHYVQVAIVESLPIGSMVHISSTYTSFGFGAAAHIPENCLLMLCRKVLEVVARLSSLAIC